MIPLATCRAYTNAARRVFENGKSTAGSWELEITDDSTFNTGTFNAWSMNAIDLEHGL